MQRSITPTPDQARSRRGFTIVELLVVIAVIGILATISIVSYGAWRHSVTSAKVKSDLNGVITAMESYRTFNNVYPATVPSSFTPSSGVILSGGSTDSKTYCVDGSSSEDESITFYVASETKDQGPLSGTCATRSTIPAPSTPSNLAVTSAISTNVGLSWSAATNAVTYTAQCASDAGFIVGVQSVTVTAPTVTATIGSLSPSNSYYCRVNAVNANSTSAWSAAVSTTTDNSYGSLAVATSIDGYWTSAPQGFLLEDGSAVARTTYADLFAVLGTTYGTGDGSTTFNLPDSRGRVGVNLNPSDTEFDTIGEKPGSKTESLTVAQLPSHNHAVAFDQVGGRSSFTDSTDSGNTIFGSNDATVAMTYWGYNGSYIQGTTTSTGGGGAHNNIQPSVVKLSAIKYSPIDSSVPTLPAGTSTSGYWSSVPVGFLFEDGSAVSRSTYSSLFATVGTTYGAGNGSTTFNLPDSRGRAAVNISSADTEFNTMGEKYGEKQHTLTLAELPSHNHAVAFDQVGGRSSFTDSTDSGNTIFGSNDATVAMTYWGYNGTYHIGSTPSTGGGGAHNNIQPSVVKLSAIKYTPAIGTATPIAVGTSTSGYWSSAPVGFLFEDGSAVSRSTYSSLFATVGTTYGAGNGSTTFNLPDSRGRVGVNLKASDTEFNTMGEKYGEKQHTLTLAQLPSHNHAVAFDQVGGRSSFTDSTDSGNTIFGSNDATVAMTYWGYNGSYIQGTTTSTGGGGAHNNIQPSIVKMFVIKY